MRAIAFLCACFIGFTFEIDHVQQGGERMESGGHSNSFGGAQPTNAPPWRQPLFSMVSRIWIRDGPQAARGLRTTALGCVYMTF